MRLVDLNHVVEHGMTTYPGLPGPVIGDHLTRAESRSHYAPGTEFHIGRIEMVANTGTYLDTPAHRYADGFDLAGLDLASVAALVGVVIDGGGRTRAIDADTLREVDVHGKAVLFRTGWDRHWATAAYANDHPYLTDDCAAALVDGGAALVGIDSLNIDDIATGERPVHSRLLAARIPIVEHLCDLHQLGNDPFSFFAVPVRVRGLGTFPVRAFAVLEV
jgi:kynurenine formamidase